MKPQNSSNFKGAETVIIQDDDKTINFFVFLIWVLFAFSIGLFAFIVQEYEPMTPKESFMRRCLEVQPLDVCEHNAYHIFEER